LEQLDIYTEIKYGDKQYDNSIFTLVVGHSHSLILMGYFRDIEDIEERYIILVQFGYVMVLWRSIDTKLYYQHIPAKI
jgi:hypothetical protein